MFVLHQTSARQRNWWQVVNERGNVGFVPSNYVEKLKVSAIKILLNSAHEKWERNKIDNFPIVHCSVSQLS